MVYKIPLFELNFDEREKEAVFNVLQNRWISSGPKTEEFENSFAKLFKVNHAVALANCTVALHLALQLIGIKDGDEVICPSLTFVATCNAIRYINAIPVFADIKSIYDLTMDPFDIEMKVTPKTKAIILMHYGGFPCDMDSILEIARKHNLKIIEDACHAPLSTYKDRILGTIGDVGCFSFFANKNISTGEGGMLVMDDTLYYKRAKLLRSHGMTTMSYERSIGHSTDYDVIELGYNYRMDDIRSAIGIVQLEKLLEDNEKRAVVRKLYHENLSDIKDLVIPFKDFRDHYSNYIFPIVLKNSSSKKRNALRMKLSEDGIQTSIHYPAVHRFSIYKNYYRDLPVTDYVSENLITLPMYSKLTRDEIVYISQRIKEFFNEK